MIRAIVQILIAEQTAPTFVTEALVGLLARPMHTSRIQDTFVAVFTLVAVFALAFPGHVALSVLWMATLGANSFGTIVALELGGILLPSRQASLLALRVAGVVAELVISGTAERVTIFPKIMGRTDQSVFIFEKGVAFSIQLGCPHVSGFQSLLDSDLTDETSAAFGLIAFVPSFDDETEGARPFEVQRK